MTDIASDAGKINTYLSGRPTERPRTEHRPPSPRLKDLDFLLGRMVTHFDTGVRMESVTRRVMHDHYIQMDLTGTYADGTWKLDGKWIIGWNEVQQQFESYYIDTMGTMGTVTSPGWQEDGHLVFSGFCVLGEVGVRTNTKDVYTVLGDHHFQLDAYVEAEGEWKHYDTQDCHVTPEQQGS
ncbi:MULTISPECIES: DUF1579 family protein [Streptomyces]|jgi:hypothetical protein|uniref:Uncharacterized protein SchU2 n=2 Tax=Streptomyces chartreusis TaxID=1969 RepID=F8QZR6_STRCX|nr:MULTISPECIES: DUF1579 family protein [Streptomyces]AEH42486.1 hypothetical protein [Streptomyces chartreusis NRRL 3882]MYS91680.1 DUF1579 domain-containing protein [Streptomyces sp. SID5464]SOR83530.1 hypothetical protein SCNRRL3882_6976 [Streptomyces chartreusis NRRL 3882]